jgi:HPt (histidine-containing phosphotransfer) domain-containing protein
MPDSRSSSSSPAAVVLDAQAVASLRALDPEGKSQLLHRVVQAFEASSARLVPQLRQALDAGDRQGIRHVAHTFKSSSASIGALSLSRHCAEIEAIIRDGTSTADGELARRVHEVIGEVEAVIGALRSLEADPA